MHFALYLQHLGETTSSKSAVEEALNAISWAHQLAGQPPISTSAFVRATVAGWKLHFEYFFLSDSSMSE